MCAIVSVATRWERVSLLKNAFWPPKDANFSLARAEPGARGQLFAWEGRARKSQKINVMTAHFQKTANLQGFSHFELGPCFWP